MLAGVLLAAAVALSACTLKDDGQAPGAIPAPPDVAAPPKDAQVTPSGLTSRVLIVGLSSVHPKLRSTVTVLYTGWTTDGKMFDSAVARGKPDRFPLVPGQLIDGWIEGLQLMVVGEKRRFWIPAKLAYNDAPGHPQGTLVFDIELVAVR